MVDEGTRITDTSITSSRKPTTKTPRESSFFNSTKRQKQTTQGSNVNFNPLSTLEIKNDVLRTTLNTRNRVPISIYESATSTGEVSL